MAPDLRSMFFTYAPVLILIPFFLSARTRLPQQRTVFCYLVLSIVTQIVSFVLWYMNINNLPILHLYTVLEFIVILYLYKILLGTLLHNRIFVALAIGFCAFALIDSLLVESIFTFNTISRSIESLVFMVLSVLWFLQALGHDEAAHKGTHYLVAGFFIYFSGSIVLFSFSNIINRMAHSLLLNIWSLHTLLLVVLYMTLSVGLLKLKKA